MVPKREWREVESLAAVFLLLPSRSRRSLSLFSSICLRGGGQLLVPSSPQAASHLVSRRHQLGRLDTAEDEVEDVEGDHVPRGVFGRLGVVRDSDEKVEDLLRGQLLDVLALCSLSTSVSRKCEKDVEGLRTCKPDCSIASAESEMETRSLSAARLRKVCRTSEMMFSSLVVRSL